MKGLRIAAGLLAATAIVSSAYGAGDQPAAAPGGMAMPPMTMAPMPALYPQAGKDGAPVFKNLGTHHHPITTDNPETQKYFDQGINLLFGFNHAEAIRSFREAARLDPNCAMCWWGVAFALGPNINLPMQPDAVAPAWDALQKALALQGHASPEERGWIQVLRERYSQDPQADRAKLDEAFAQGMGRLWIAFHDDLDSGVFYAEAMMDTQPWNYWEADGKTPRGHGAEIVSTLEEIIKREPNHPGALHLYIHAVEASNSPERAEAAADRLETLMPDAGHIVHMPSHIYFRVGRYKDAAHVNELAAEADENYVEACKAQGFYPLAYYTHNLHFLWTSSSMMGQYAAAEDAAHRVVKNAAQGAPMAAAIPPVQLYMIVPFVTDIRFGKWDKALAEPKPSDDLKLVKAVWLYTQGFAHANKGAFKQAVDDRAQLAAMIDNKEFAAIDAFPVPGTQLAQLGLTLVDAEIARKQGHVREALAAFRKANDLYNALPYTEPDYWYQPVSHLYGAALLQAHRPKEAEKVYRASLDRHRIDGWALYGLMQSLKAQGKVKQAATVKKDFALAWQLADVKLTSSRF